MKKVLSVLLVAVVCHAWAQQRQPNAAEIQLKLKKLNVLASVLYVAAHPDDENTRAITWMANERLANAAYLSMTRGDGGQNLIGPEIRDLLGLIRTQELLAARRLDGGQQFFTRANDFGFSKSADEAMSIWGKDQILSDVVRVYRQFKPDIILTRFPPDERAGHGHHTASAMLAQEAFDVSGREDFLPEQVREFGAWQPKRVYTNTGRWWNQTINENTPGVVSVNMGTYNTLLGKSYAEIAAESRSQHKSQGFGSAGRRGDSMEFFEFAKGEKASKDLFEGINTTWTRVVGGERVQPLVEHAIRNFNPEQPHLTIPMLLQIRKEIMALAPSVWRERKLREVQQLIQDCAGLFIEVTAQQPWIAPGEQVIASVEVVNRSAAPIRLMQARSPLLSIDTTLQNELTINKLVTFRMKRTLSSAAGYSDPYWLREDHSQGIFHVPSASFIGKPENDPSVPVQFDVEVAGQRLTIEVPVVYKSTDPVKGEVTRPFEVVPPVFVNWAQRVYVFKDANPVKVALLVKSSSSAKMDGEVRLSLPEGWKSTPATMPVSLSKRGEEKRVEFTVTPGTQQGSWMMHAEVSIAGKSYHQSLQTISYDHIPFQTLLPEAEASAVRMDLRKEGQLVAYIAGAGDEVPSALRNMGYEVWEMKDDEVTAANLARVDAVVLGVRALNTNDRLRYQMPDLLAWVKKGGTMVVQYNTTGDIGVEAFSPYPISISRDRVTEEDSEVRILAADHPILNTPNKITADDFKGWVQERGLYFPDKWDAAFTPILSMNDKGEPARNGALLVARSGEGYFVYTGLSFFRELPEGVPGAYRLFANLTSLGRAKKPQNQKVKINK